MTQPQVPTLTVAKLPDGIRELFLQLADDDDRTWKTVAAVLDQMFEDAKAEKIRLPRMKMYADSAACLGQKLSTVRNWANVYHKVGEALLNQYGDTFRYSHWRAMVPAARRAHKSLADFAEELAKTEDKYGGLPIPPDVIIARTGTDAKTDQELFEESLEAAQKAFMVLAGRVDKVKPEMQAMVLAQQNGVEKLAAQYEKLEEEAKEQAAA